MLSPPCAPSATADRPSARRDRNHSPRIEIARCPDRAFRQPTMMHARSSLHPCQSKDGGGRPTATARTTLTRTRTSPTPPHPSHRGGLSKGYTEMPSPGIEPGTFVSGAVRRNRVPRLKVGTQWGYISYIYPRTARATGSRSTSTIGEIVGPRDGQGPVNGASERARQGADRRRSCTSGV